MRPKARASKDLRERLAAEVMRIPAIDVHSHVPAREPVARTLAELLGYHYYTELAHSAGLAQGALPADRPAEEAVPVLLEALRAADNTVQYGWLNELAAELFGFTAGKVTPENWRPLAEAVERNAREPERAGEVLARSRIARVFLTNSFDEDLSALDRGVFVPSLRLDSLVFGMSEPATRDALEQTTGVSVSDASSLREGLGALVDRFARNGARSVAVSLPPRFRAVCPDDAQVARVLGRGIRSSPSDRDALAGAVLFAAAGLCRQFGLACQVVYGALRNAYAHAVPQGGDLPEAGDTLSGLLPLLNAFPDVTFCLSVLSVSQAQELTSYGWIFQNVVLSGHWWYCNVPEYIARDLSARLQCVPKTKLIGYYSDMYKLEFGLPKFNMYRRILARVLAEDFVEGGRGTEEEAAALARLLLHGNAARIFRLEV